MKRLFNRIVILIFSLTLILTLSGCSVLLTDNQTASGLGIADGAVEIQLNKQSIFCDTKNNTGVSSVSEVKFNTMENAQALSSVEAAKLVMRSVVSINMKNLTSESKASGVIVDIEGGLNKNEYYVLTSHHVVADGGQITICIPDDDCNNKGDLFYDENYIFTGIIGATKQSNQAVTLVGSDVLSDIAILKLNVGNRKNYKQQPVSIVKSTFTESSATIEYAEEVFAIGNPSGSLPMTFLSGNISYLGRYAFFDSVGFIEIIQHDCMITYGSSGGGLYNMKGQLIGITNGGSGEHKGMNFAIPFYGEEGIMAVATELIKSNTTTNFGYVAGRWTLGLNLTTSDKVVKGSNVVVASVEKDSNAYGYINSGYYITKVSFGLNMTYTITDLDEFTYAYYVAREYLEVGDKITITVAYYNY